MATREERAAEERLRWHHYQTISQKHWRMMSGRHPKILSEHAVAFNLPCAGPFVDLTVLARAFHDLLRDNSRKILADEKPPGDSDDALQRYRHERAELAKLDRLEREGSLVRIEVLREAFGRVAALIRAAGDALSRRYGNDAGRLLIEALDDAEATLDRYFGNANSNGH